jgi:hypothetical protein
MNLDRYIIDLRAQLAASAVTGGVDTRVLAERLSTALDAAARLVLLEALSDAASEITLELIPGGVDVRLRGRDPEFVVTRPPVELDDAVPATAPPPAPEPAAATGAEDDATASRTTVRIPDHLKARAERAAAEAGLSLNSWLVRAIAAALEPSALESSDPRAAQRGRRGDSFTGWVR